MRKISLIFSVLLLASTASAQAIEQTICFSQDKTGILGMLGDDVRLNGGKCQGVKLADMNKRGWKLVFVVSGLNSAFGMVFEKV